jgi:hypothetical protein
MVRVVVAGSDADPFFAVVDFSDPANPVVTRVAPDPQFPFGACRVAIDGAHVIVGDSQGGDLRLLDVSDPAHPATLGFLRTDLAGVAAVNIKGARVVAGELFGASTVRVILVDISAPGTPAIIGTAIVPFASGAGSGPPNPSPGPPAAAAISSVAFLSDTVVAVSGPNQLQVTLVDFADPARPQVTNFSRTNLAGPPAIDAKNGRFAAGDGNGSKVNLFDAQGNALDSFTTPLFPVSQVAMSPSFILATSAEDALVACIPLDGRPVTSLVAGLGLGLVPNIDGELGVCGGNESTFLQLIDLSVDPPVLLGARANAMFPMVTTVGVSAFGAAGGGGQGGGGGAQGGQGGHGGHGGHPGVVPPGGQGDHLARPFSLRPIMISVHLAPARGLRIVRPRVTSVFQFCVQAFEGITRYTE